MPRSGNGTLFTEGLHELRSRIWQHYQGTEPSGRDDAEIGVRIEGVVRAWDYAE